ncbi:MAG: exodeoxyribonuclease III [Kiloniellales bacterium]
MPLRIATWNVNSLRQRLGHLARLTAEAAPDVVCLQETKVEDGAFPLQEVKALGYSQILHNGQKSYNGVAILSRLALRPLERRRWCRKDDCRHLAVVLPGDIELHNFYVPSGGPVPDPAENDKFAHKLAFLKEMAAWAKREKVAQRKLVLVGDLNVAPLETDVWNHKRLVRSVGHTPGESALIAALLKAGSLSDVPRRFVPPDQPLYTWWGYRFAESFQKDYGWRLDHIFASPPMAKHVQTITVRRQTRAWERPSDHVPVVLELS